jgi:hypothetical protein
MKTTLTRHRRAIAIAALASMLAIAGVAALRSRARTCSAITLPPHRKVYGISSKDIGWRLPCATVHRVVRRWAEHRHRRRVDAWTVVYHRDCQCRTATSKLRGRRVSFTFNST